MTLDCGIGADVEACLDLLSADLAEWGELLIRGWNKAGWMDMPTKVGNRVARLIGAEAGDEVTWRKPSGAVSLEIVKITLP